jgi:hypothetical protein
MIETIKAPPNSLAKGATFGGKYRIIEIRPGFFVDVAGR